MSNEQDVVLRIDRTLADDLLVRLLESPYRRDGADAHEYFLIVQLADALGVDIAEWMRDRAAVFAA